ncbi:hypothetical protein RAS2_21380 [Phycisphaerae bacterium RAS2]|nr:hypothetical protein RAS2_21380 [Phycisphaerae bacterium RAS2]
MAYVLAVIIGLIAGALCVYLGMEQRRLSLQRISTAIEQKLREVDELRSSSRRELAQKREDLLSLYEKAASRLESQRSRLSRLLKKERDRIQTSYKAALERIELRKRELDLRDRELNRLIEQQKKQVISYEEHKNENVILKRDLLLLITNLRKLELDRDLLKEEQASLDLKISELGSRYLKENVKWIGRSLRDDNFTQCKDRLLDVISRCREAGLKVSVDEENALVSELRRDYEAVVKTTLAREEQARIKARIREEALREREIQREKERIEQEESAIKAALKKALADAQQDHTAEVEELKRRLEEAESRMRTVSQAELTKTGTVYVISNIGSFGEGIFKIGMTRRLEPLDRIKELSDASVPFPFDVHMMITTENAPSLEHKLHHALHKMRINKANPRKEFFRIDMESIVNIVRENHGTVEYVAEPEALQYHESLSMSDEDHEYIESLYEADDDDDLVIEKDVSPA